MDTEGYLAISQTPGIGYEFDWEFIYANKVVGWALLEMDYGTFYHLGSFQKQTFTFVIPPGGR